MVKDSRNGIREDKYGVPLESTQLVVAEIIKKPVKAEVGGKKVFLGPAIRRICGKLIVVGSKKSLIQPENGPSEEVDNAKIQVIT